MRTIIEQQFCYCQGENVVGTVIGDWLLVIGDGTGSRGSSWLVADGSWGNGVYRRERGGRREKDEIGDVGAHSSAPTCHSCESRNPGAKEVGRNTSSGLSVEWLIMVARSPYLNPSFAKYSL